LASLTACANVPTGKSLEQMLAADPRLRENPATFGSASDSKPQPEAIAQLPPDFPQDIPLYPNAQLKEVTQPTPQVTDEPDSMQANQTQQTRWVTSDPSNLVQSFYQKEFQANNWEILSQPTDGQGGTLEARRDDLQVTVSIPASSATNNNVNATPPSPSNPGQNLEAGNSFNPPGTDFIIGYTRHTSTTAQAAAPQPSEPDFIGPVPPQTPTQQAQAPDTNPQTAATSNQFTDINKAPQELRQYIEDLAALGVLPLEPTGSKSNQSTNTNQFEPTKTISHREYARWLVAANNAMHVNSPAKQIRGASETSQPAFQDVPRTDPDFPEIQGLAEAGLIPSPLSGDSTAVLFRPDAPLTREQLILWKVPLDTRQGLPKASVDAVQQTWGFQDAARIDPKAMRAVLADFQNSEQSNIRRVFGYTTLFQPKKPVTRAEAAAALWYFGSAGEGLSAQEALQVQRQESQPSPTSEPETSN